MLCLALSCLVSCAAPSQRDLADSAKSDESGPPPSSVRGVSRLVLDVESARGVSGLDRVGAGFVVVPERGGELLFVDELGVVTVRPLAGIPTEIDVEGIATLPGGSFLLATESLGVSVSEALYVAHEGPDGYVVGEPYMLTADTAAGWTFEDNAGLEGICVAGTIGLAAVEVVYEVDGRRMAPLLMFSTNFPDGPDKTVAAVYLAVPLTSPTGKISALDCQQEGDEIVITMIERHFGLGRILVARIPVTASGPGDLHITDVLDLGTVMGRDENFEGVAALEDGQLALVNDNDYGGISGPTELIVVRRP